jgi:3-oxoacyl-[acyl-carrier protein] reductase
VASQEAARRMGAGGRIILIGSVNRDFVPFPGRSLYALTKGALAGFAHGLARELGPRGITVNVVEPGPIATDTNPADGPFASHVRERIAVGRYGEGEEVAAFVSFLASAEAAFVTGASLRVDGGFSA